MKKHKIIKIIVLSIFIIAVVIAIVPKRIEFYNHFSLRKMPEEEKQLTRDIYNQFDDRITRVIVSYDSTTFACIRFVFFSKEKLSIQEQQPVLDAIFSYIKSHETDSRATFLNIWEVFFCADSVPYGAYISRYEDNNAIVETKGGFRDWYSVPNVEEILSYDSLMLMLDRIEWPMYSLNNPRPIEEMAPDISGD